MIDSVTIWCVKYLLFLYYVFFCTVFGLESGVYREQPFSLTSEVVVRSEYDYTEYVVVASYLPYVYFDALRATSKLMEWKKHFSVLYFGNFPMF